ncbi:MAG: divalent-cation tolerance protein CutA [Caulobacteraceae bacterium]
MQDVVLIYTTWPDAETADVVAAEAVERRLAACANRLAPMRSTYRWEGKVEHGDETPMLFKTVAATAEALKAFIVDRHPHDLPCVVALPISASGSHIGFLEWIAAESG